LVGVRVGEVGVDRFVYEFLYCFSDLCGTSACHQFAGRKVRSIVGLDLSDFCADELLGCSPSLCGDSAGHPPRWKSCRLLSKLLPPSRPTPPFSATHPSSYRLPRLDTDIRQPLRLFILQQSIQFLHNTLVHQIEVRNDLVDAIDVEVGVQVACL
jgi:hypothetical protein